MNVRCPTCETIYRVDPAKVPEGGVKARCAVCSAIIPVTRSVAAEPAAVQLATAGTSTVRPSPPPPPRPSIGTPAQRPVAPTATPGPQPRPAARAPRPQGPPRPSAPVFRPAVPSAGTGGAAQTVRPPVSPAAPKAPGLQPPAAPAVPGPATAHINPFLAQDPKQKARRLARALVSDMIVYQPEKRQKALKEGNLKEAFAEEIKKSWEEYVLQVGEELANSTTYFTDALNEILAGGQKIF